MKLLSIAVPCYNSAAYMEKCVESLLTGGDVLEILIVDDGSKDETAAIADRYAQQYPEIVRAIHQENAGHGGAVMTGLANASGLYYKVVDSDDWLDPDALRAVLERLRQFATQEHPVDVLISNYIYDKVGVTRKRTIHYESALPENRILHWDDVGSFHKGQYLLMHSLIYRTDLLRQSGLSLPKHTFYVDNLYAYTPLASVETLYYLNVNLYHYYIGREDQSVQEQTMIRRIDQQILVNKQMMEQVDLRALKNKQQRGYMLNYLEIVTAVSSIMLIRANTPEALEKKRALWQYMRKEYPWIYRRLRRRTLGVALNLPGRMGRSISSTGYRLSRKLFGFN